MYKESSKIILYRWDSRFWSIITNAVRKNCWTKDDPRWDKYNKNKEKHKNSSTTLNKRSKINKSGYVYFIQNKNGGPIKIGYSKNPKERLGNVGEKPQQL